MSDTIDTARFIRDTLLTIPKYGNGIGLHRMRWLMQRIQSSEPCQFKAIKVTGSNGKGSVCAMLSEMLEQLHITHGLYTSPHLFRFNERIRFGSTEITDEELIDAIHWYSSQQAEFKQAFPDDRIGAFEAFTAIALQVFATRKIDCLVSEAGIGGRYDSTRMIPGAIAALTSLDLEHTNLLGNTLEQIAYDKADLCPPGGTLVIGEMAAELQQRLAAYCEVKQIRMLPATKRCKVLDSWLDGRVMKVNLQVDEQIWSELVINLTGKHQQRNAEVAITTLLEWLEAYAPEPVHPATLEAAIRRALAKVSWHGRCTLVQTDPEVYIDVGHSPRAVQAAIDSFQELLQGRKVLLVTGVSHDKDVAGILQQILPIADEVIATRAYHNGSKVDEIARLVQLHAPTLPVTQAATIELAMQSACLRARQHGMVVVVAGGLFLSIEAETALRGDDPQKLKFF